MKSAHRFTHFALALWLAGFIAPPCTAEAEQAAAPAPTVQATLSANEQKSVWVGQAVTLQVQLSVPGYFSSSVNFDIPDPEGVLLMPPAGHPVVSTKTLNDTRYTVQQYELRAWAMRPGEQSIPAIRAHFSFKRSPLDTDGISQILKVPAIPFTVKVPPGAESLGTIISAHNLKLEEHWEPEPNDNEVKAGAAYIRTITFTAPDVPGMIFPPFPADKIDGVGVYAKRQLLDSDNRGTLVGVRKDKITYLVQRPGQFTIPTTQFTWFDLDTNELRTETLAARTFHVVANPDMASANLSGDADQASDRAVPRSWYGTITGVVIPLIIIGVLLFLMSRNPRIRGGVMRATDHFRPIHLQALNPTEQPEVASKPLPKT